MWLIWLPNLNMGGSNAAGALPTSDIFGGPHVSVPLITDVFGGPHMSVPLTPDVFGGPSKSVVISADQFGLGKVVTRP